ncbi:MAG: ABC transporter permease [Nodosilinea sp. WJT8-NPBG4]|jgi:lipopolysaccharide transport system permease protein|nr:ABC transporter permease [Nodosilinea sp. WJT8-NPBG4]
MAFIRFRRRSTFSSYQKPLKYYQDLLKCLVDREIKLLYKRSFLGIAWTLINPLLQLAVFIFIFQVVLPVDVPQYSSFVFTGLLVWTWFQNSLFQATGVIIANISLIRQPGFPVAILPVVIVTTGLIHFTLALPILLLFLIFDGAIFSIHLLWVPALQLIQFLLIITLAYFLASLNVKFRDTQHTLGVVLQLLFYLTPIFYEVESIPLGYKSLYYLNPLVHLVSSYRNILMYGESPNLLNLMIVTLMIGLFLPIGYRLFKEKSYSFVEEL